MYVLVWYKATTLLLPNLSSMETKTQTLWRGLCTWKGWLKTKKPWRPRTARTVTFILSFTTNCKKLLDDPLWVEIEKIRDAKGLLLAITKIMLLPSSGDTHQGTHIATMIYHALRQHGTILLERWDHLQSTISWIQARRRYRPGYGCGVSALSESVLKGENGSLWV